MYNTTFNDPLGSRLPALERSVLLLRASQMSLVLFYAEELKREILGLVEANEGLIAMVPDPKAKAAGSLKGIKNPVEKALQALLADGAITQDEKTEIVGLIDYRNDVAHQMHAFMAELSTERWARRLATSDTQFVKKYRMDAVDRLSYYRTKLWSTHKRYALRVGFNSLMFSGAEQAFLSEINRLKRKIKRLSALRLAQLDALNDEMNLDRSVFRGNSQPGSPLCRFDDGRLTQRGVEICYRLFDLGKSPMAVALLMGMKLDAARNRKRSWIAQGGAGRDKKDLAKLPIRKFRVDD